MQSVTPSHGGSQAGGVSGIAPNSILKRAKEGRDNEAKAAKRNRLANRRVSFAPDEELETMHLYCKDDKRMEPSQDTEDLALRYPPPAPLTDENLVQQQAAQAQADPFSFKPPSYAAATSQSPGFSPLSMDLTNNSFDTNQMRGSQQGGSQQWQAAAPSPGGDYFTRNITGNIPNLSTLVEEDEECGYEVSQQGQQQQQQAVPITALSPLENTSPMAGLAMPPPQNNSAAPLAMSPASPFVLQEMQRRGESDDEDVKNKWGFAPGADDTLEVSYGHHVLGDTTYNHVYGAGVTGDITKAMKNGNLNRALPGLTDGTTNFGMPPAADMSMSPLQVPQMQQQQNPGPQVQPPAAPPAYQHMGMAAQAATAEPQQQQQMQVHHMPAGRRSSVPMPMLAAMHATPHSVAENTIRLLEDDQTDAWRIGGAFTGRASVASNKFNTRRLGETTQLLTGTTNPMNTANLLADTTHQGVLERFAQNQKLAPLPGAEVFNRPSMPMPASMPMADVTAASISGADAHGAKDKDNTAMSMDFSVGGQLGQTHGLLEEASLSLDHFAVPPEPGMSQQLQQPLGMSQGNPYSQPMSLCSQQVALSQGQRQVSFGGNELQGSQLPMMSPMWVPGSQPQGSQLASQQQQVAFAVPQQQARPAPRVPSISCQEFLGIIDVSFNDKVCRTSFLPQSDPPPKTVADVYEGAHVTAPRVEVYQQLMIDVSSRLSKMQGHVAAMEGEMTATNPQLFAAVQVASPADLDRIRDQMVSLKKLCRIRTVKSIKQAYLASLDELSTRLAASQGALMGELSAMQGFVREYEGVQEKRTALRAGLVKAIQQAGDQHQDELARKKVLEAQLARLQALQAQNMERQRVRDEARRARAEAVANKAPVEALHTKGRVLEEKLAAISGGAGVVPVGLTPGSEGRMKSMVAKKQDELHMLLGLHGQQVSLAEFASSARFSVSFRSKVAVVGTIRERVCSLAVELTSAAAAAASSSSSSSSSPAGPCLFSQLVQSSMAGQTVSVPVAQLPQALEQVPPRLHALAAVSSQVERAWAASPYFTKYELTRQVLEGQDQAEAPTPCMTLWFVNADSVTKLGVHIPVEDLPYLDVSSPRLSTTLLTQCRDQAVVEGQAAQLQALMCIIPRSYDYVARLCVVLGAVLHPAAAAEGSAPSQVDAADVTGSLMAQAGQMPLTTPARVFSNPLFTAAAVTAAQ